MDIKINQSDYKKVVTNNKLVLLDFYADWCAPCQTLLPTIEKLAKEYNGEIAIKKVNIDENRELATNLQIKSIPSLIYFSEGEVIGRSTGVVPENELRIQLKKLVENLKN